MHPPNEGSLAGCGL